MARSTTEAELAAANEAVFHEALPIQVLLEKVMRSSISTTLLKDNSSCIQIIRAGYSPKLRSMSKTHRISVAALAEAVEENLIEVSHIDTKAQLADDFYQSVEQNDSSFSRSSRAHWSVHKFRKSNPETKVPAARLRFTVSLSKLPNHHYHHPIIHHEERIVFVVLSWEG